MPSPFPGMDPYLGLPRAWSGVHFSLISALQDVLNPLLRPTYFARGEERVYLSGDADPGHTDKQPDLHVVDPKPAPPGGWAAGKSTATITQPVPVLEPEEEEVHERFLEIRSVLDRSVVAVVEVLSPSNKTMSSDGRASFLRKRREVTATPTHWLEIDLLRGGYRTVNSGATAGAAYQVFLSRATDGRERVVWPIGLRDRLPVVALPLRAGDPDVPLDLQAVLDRAYERGGYDLSFDYATDPVPPLPPADLAWARELTAHRR